MAQQPNPKLTRRLLILTLAFGPILILWGSLTVTIPSGHAGLLFHTFGDGIDPEEQPMNSGFHFKAPWNKVYEYEIRQKERQEKLEVLSSNLLKIEMDMTVFYQPDLKNLGLLEIERGKNYEEKVVVPAMRSVSREVIASTSRRIQHDPPRRDPIRNRRAHARKARRKLPAAQRRIDPQHPPATQVGRSHRTQAPARARITGIRIPPDKAAKKPSACALKPRASAITKKSFPVASAKSCPWKGIEATSALANSQNTKVVVIGSAKDGLPLILGDN